MTIVNRFVSELPSSYVDPLAERRENSYKNTPKAEAYNERRKTAQAIVVNGKEYKK